METEFWLKVWEEKNIGFHRSSANPALKAYFPTLGIPERGRVLVPLCGKSRDLDWFRGRGYHPIGVEISPIAVEEYYSEHSITPRRTREERFERWSGGGVDILLGDFFDSTKEDLSSVDGFYDRASLIAFPERMRARYVEHLSSLLLPGTPGLLLTLEYDQNFREGPPFSLTDNEVRTLFESSFSITLLSEENRTESSSVPGLVHRVYLLTRIARD